MTRLHSGGCDHLATGEHLKGGMDTEAAWFRSTVSELIRNLRT